ncbi:bifunctional N(6)-L-threonylcarbamoyladenine synthase/serine/threonine protein kinase [Candidatus Woesearchaeota archaeon]|nr:bifunctional N(6)-L-threonylcarbamoyladenine synthase/serine/threonine protein kinase [Candidatus Woesearchaeota archaeon]
MICLGIESTAHTFGVGIVKERKVLANVIDMYKPRKGGIIPYEASDHHVEVCDGVINAALEKAGLLMEDIDVFAFSQSPGLGNCLKIGAMVARSLSVLHKKPIVGVNHCVAHLEIGSLCCGSTDPVLLYVSGANTQVIAFEGGKYRVFGETLDIGIGNLLDAFARELGIGFPGGPKIEEMALKSRNYIELPYVVKGMDVSFGGILTNLKQKIRSKKLSAEDLCFSVQETVFAMLVEVSERAMAHCNKKELLLGGGVACNLRLQEMCSIMCKERNAKFFVPEKQFLLDNGAMIAWHGLISYKAGNTTSIEDSYIKPYERTDDVLVSWKQTDA